MIEINMEGMSSSDLLRRVENIHEAWHKSRHWTHSKMRLILSKVWSSFDTIFAIHIYATSSLNPILVTFLTEYDRLEDNAKINVRCNLVLSPWDRPLGFENRLLNILKEVMMVQITTPTTHTDPQVKVTFRAVREETMLTDQLEVRTLNYIFVCPHCHARYGFINDPRDSAGRIRCQNCNKWVVEGLKKGNSNGQIEALY
jgi:hypothetical protein